MPATGRSDKADPSLARTIRLGAADTPREVELPRCRWEDLGAELVTRKEQSYASTRRVARELGALFRGEGGSRSRSERCCAQPRKSTRDKRGDGHRADPGSAKRDAARAPR